MLFTAFSTAPAADPLTLRMLTWQGYAPVSQVDKFREIILNKYGLSSISKSPMSIPLMTF
ncbi:hypothetical protein [Aliamphritea spongicola]|nr:hypothetical protein [Aliamphritea spongicola]